MVDRYQLSPKFGLNSFSGIWENDVYGPRWMMDAHMMTGALLCSSTSRAKKDTNSWQQVLWMYIMLPVTKGHLSNKDRII